jgi:hypothetical protein
MATPPDFSPGQVLTAAHMDAVGLWLVKSVTVGSAVASVDVTSCFNADYDNYVVQFSGITTSANGTSFLMKLLSGTTATTTGWYGNTYFVVNGTNAGLTAAIVSNAAGCEVGNLSSASTNHGEFNVQGPYLASYTRTNFFGADNNYLRWCSSVHRASTSYDGLQFYPFSGTMTGGIINVYGYRK